MSSTPLQLKEIGLEVVDLTSDVEFRTRRLHPRDASATMDSMRRLAEAFVERPESILQELVDAAVNLCGADSAGISLEREDRTEKDYYRWVATAGVYTPFLDASLPRYPSACSVCLERGSPQLFRVNKRFFDILGVEAALVTDGILLPWEVEEMRGTIFVIAHGRHEAFDSEDLRLMQVLANFAALGVRNQRQHKKLLAQASAAAAAEMANELAHEINNPLQVLTNKLYLATQQEGSAKALALSLQDEFERLSGLVKKLLNRPRDRT